VLKDEEVEALAAERAAVCGVCEHKLVNVCRLCGCLLSVKARSPRSFCPDGRWAR
jgi:hypothetical protein